jgi:hypothetical protein
MVGIRLLHVYAHLISIALAEGVGEDLNSLGFGDTQYWNNAMVFHIRVVLNLDRFVDF